MASSFSTPILFLVFNRPDTTQRVFDAIKQVKPGRLFVAADGPRINHTEEAERCEAVRSIIKQVDWDCELKTLFRSENLGCGKAVSSAITWFFEHVEEGIILEDDCLPHPSFFTYCQELLEYYRHNDKVMFIGGSQFLDACALAEESYYFSAMNHVWGWATWKTTWMKYKFNTKEITRKNFKKNIKYYFPNPSIRRSWLWLFYLMRYRPIDTWDYQLVFSIWKNEGLAIVPTKNLVSNIGFRNDATHTHSDSTGVANLPTFDIGTLKHPSVVIQNQQIDEAYSIKQKQTLSRSKYVYYIFRLFAKYYF